MLNKRISHDVLKYANVKLEFELTSPSLFSQYPELEQHDKLQIIKGLPEITGLNMASIEYLLKMILNLNPSWTDDDKIQIFFTKIFPTFLEFAITIEKNMQKYSVDKKNVNYNRLSLVNIFDVIKNTLDLFPLLKRIENSEYLKKLINLSMINSNNSSQFCDWIFNHFTRTLLLGHARLLEVQIFDAVLNNIEKILIQFTILDQEEWQISLNYLDKIIDTLSHTTILDKIKGYFGISESLETNDIKMLNLLDWIKNIEQAIQKYPSDAPNTLNVILSALKSGTLSTNSRVDNDRYVK